MADPLSLTLSVSQLINMALGAISTVTGLYNQVQTRPQCLQEQLRQISRLHSTISNLQQNVKESERVREHLYAIIAGIEELRVILERGIEKNKNSRVLRIIWIALKGKQEDETIKSIFINIEQEKSSLNITINSEVYTAIMDKEKVQDEVGMEWQSEKNALVPYNSGSSSNSSQYGNANGYANTRHQQGDEFGKVTANTIGKVRQGNMGALGPGDQAGPRHKYDGVEAKNRIDEVHQGNDYRKGTS